MDIRLFPEPPRGHGVVARLGKFDGEAFLTAGKKYTLNRLLLLEDAAKECLALEVSEKQSRNDQVEMDLVNALGRFWQQPAFGVRPAGAGRQNPPITRGIQDEEQKAKLSELKSAMRGALKVAWGAFLAEVFSRLQRKPAIWRRPGRTQSLLTLNRTTPGKKMDAALWTMTT